jgi:hypothetical protein
MHAEKLRAEPQLVIHKGAGPNVQGNIAKTKEQLTHPMCTSSALPWQLLQK